MNRTFVTKDAQLAALLRHELGKNMHVATSVDASGTAYFEFDKHTQCLSIMRAFYADNADADFVPGYPVNDARALLKEASAVRKELAIARDQWRRAQEEKEG